MAGRRFSMHSLPRALSRSSLCKEGASQIWRPRWIASQPREVSHHVQALADQLSLLSPAELKALREECRQRMIAKPVGKPGPAKKDYNPVLKVRRSDAPFPMRGKLAEMGQRIPGAIRTRLVGINDTFAAMHPVWKFAGQGPGVVPVPMPAITAVVMARHVAAMSAQMGAGVPGGGAPVAAAPVQPAPAAAAEEAAEDAPAAGESKEETAAKANVIVKLAGFEAKKKIAVLKEVRALLGIGLKESKELVESAPVVLKKAVPIADAEPIAERLRAAGAEISLE